MPYISDESKAFLGIMCVICITALVVFHFAEDHGKIIYDRCMKTHTADVCNFVRQITQYKVQEMTLECVDHDKFPVSVCYYFVGTP